MIYYYNSMKTAVYSDGCAAVHNNVLTKQFVGLSDRNGRFARHGMHATRAGIPQAMDVRPLE